MGAYRGLHQQDDDGSLRYPAENTCLFSSGVFRQRGKETYDQDGESAYEYSCEGQMQCVHPSAEAALAERP